MSPEGTLWALSTCALATVPDSFRTFDRLFSGGGMGGGGTGDGGGSMGRGIGNNIVDADLCLWLANEDLFYDVLLSQWGAVVGNKFRV